MMGDTQAPGVLAGGRREPVHSAPTPPRRWPGAKSPDVLRLWCRSDAVSFVLWLEEPQRGSAPMLYAILCYDSEDVVGSWSKEEDDAVMAKLGVVQEKLAREGRLGP